MVRLGVFMTEENRSQEMQGHLYEDKRVWLEGAAGKGRRRGAASHRPQHRRRPSKNIGASMPSFLRLVRVIAEGFFHGVLSRSVVARSFILKACVRLSRLTSHHIEQKVAVWWAT